jgi:glycosyltransferase involved in cell wall biosynthesis
MPKIIIIIPAFNEKDNIKNVILSLKETHPDFDCVVINDASLDSTQKEAESTKKAFVIQLPVNLGIGGAVQTGFKFARENDYDYAIQFDGDGQHLSTEIPKILSPVMSGECDSCIGSRFLDNNEEGFKSSASRRFGIGFFKYLNKLLINQTISDSTSGFRAYNKKTISFLARYYPTDYPEPETIVLLGKNNFVIKEVSVLMQERQGGQSSISGFKPIYYMLKVSLAMIMAAIRKKIDRATYE